MVKIFEDNAIEGVFRAEVDKEYEVELLEKSFAKAESIERLRKLAEKDLNAFEKISEEAYTEEQVDDLKTKIAKFLVEGVENDIYAQKFCLAFRKEGATKRRLKKIIQQAGENVENYQMKIIEVGVLLDEINDLDFAETSSDKLEEFIEKIREFVPENRDPTKKKSLRGLDLTPQDQQIYREKQAEISQAEVDLAKEFFGREEQDLTDYEKKLLEEADNAEEIGKVVEINEQ